MTFQDSTAGPLQRAGRASAVVRHRAPPAAFAMCNLDANNSAIPVEKGVFCCVCNQLGQYQGKSMTLRRWQRPTFDRGFAANTSWLENGLRQGAAQALEECCDRNCLATGIVGQKLIQPAKSHNASLKSIDRDRYVRRSCPPEITAY